MPLCGIEHCFTLDFMSYRKAKSDMTLSHMENLARIY